MVRLPESDWGWHAEELPPGFRKVAHMRHDLDGDGVEAEHIMFSDGLASVSAYIEPVSGDAIRGQSRIGPVSTFADVVSGKQVVVVGDVPPATVQAIGASMTPTNR